MADVRDILGVPRGQASERQEAPKTKEKMQRPAGMSREAFALLGGSHPIVPSQLTEELRKKEDLKGLKEKRKNAKGQVRVLCPVSQMHITHNNTPAVSACHRFHLLPAL
jgi:DNA methyltransferase 1-associated protein 1